MAHRFASDYPIAYVTVDVVVFAIREDRLEVLAVDRGDEPAGWALPGGFVHPDEDLRDAAVRELREETDVDVDALPLEQLATYGAPDRDLRYAGPPAHARVVSVAWLAVLPEASPPRGSDEVREARWRPVAELLAEGLAFDHDRILRDALERLRAKLEYTPVATAFLAEEFTLGELRRVYEIVWGRPLDPGNFQRRVRNTIAAPTGTVRSQGRGRPAETFRALRRPADAWRPE